MFFSELKLYIRTKPYHYQYYNLPLKMNFNLLSFFIFFFIATAALSQEKADYQFQTFSPEGGFNYDGVKKIQQDSNGFIWILMDNDLFRFDGYEHKSYQSHFSQYDEQLEKTFRDIVVDQKGQLFVLVTDGLYTYDILQNTFTRISKGNFLHLWSTPDNTLLTTKSNQLVKYDREANQFIEFLYQGKPLTRVQSIIPEENGFFILSWGRNIFRYNNDTEEITLFYAFKNDNYIKGVCKINNTIWCLSSDNRLNTLDIPTGEFMDSMDFYQIQKIYILK